MIPENPNPEQLAPSGLEVSEIEGGFPHSDMFGSQSARNSPNLIATCYVLHRLSVPRHPPNALVMLDPYQKSDILVSTVPLQGSIYKLQG